MKDNGGVIIVNIVYGSCSKLVSSNDKRSKKECDKYNPDTPGPMNYYQVST